MAAFSNSLKRTATAGILLAAVFGRNAQAAEPDPLQGVTIYPDALAKSLLQMPADQWPEERLRGIEMFRKGTLKKAEDAIPAMQILLMQQALSVLNATYIQEQNQKDYVRKQGDAHRVFEQQLRQQASTDPRAAARLPNIMERDKQIEDASLSNLGRMQDLHDGQNPALQPYLQELRQGVPPASVQEHFMAASQRQVKATILWMESILNPPAPQPPPPGAPAAGPQSKPY